MSSNPLKDASEFFDKMYKKKDKRIAELEAALKEAINDRDENFQVILNIADLARKETDRQRKLIRVQDAFLQETYDRFRQYEMDVDGDATLDHKQYMRRLVAIRKEIDE